MAIQPTGDRVVVRPMDEKDEKRGALYIPDTAKEKPMEGTVVEVGSGKMLDDGKKAPLEVQKGDRVMYGKYSGTEITVGDEKLLIMRESEILAIVKG